MKLAITIATLIATLTSCEGSGCTPGDYVTTCAKACSFSGVLLINPTNNICICRERAAPAEVPP